MNNKIRISILEDDALIAENMRFILEDLGYEVVHISYHIQDAIKTISQKNTDLFILDINLGEGKESEGLQVAGHVQESGKPFIFLTAYSDRDTIQKATQLKPDAYLIKPVNPAGIFAAIQTAIKNQQDKQPLKEKSTEEKEDYFFVRMGNLNHKISWEEVYCLEAGKNYVKLRLVQSGNEYPIRGSLNLVLEQLLPAKLRNEFIRISRSVCLNKNFITAYGSREIYCGKECFENTKFSRAELQELLGSILL